MMMLTVLQEFAAFMLLLSTPCGLAVPLSSFYPYGPAAGDTSLPPNDDGSSPAITLPTPFPFYGIYYSTIYVNNNGDLSFGQPWSRTTETFPIPIPLVAVYLADVDTRGTGSVWYRCIQNTTLVAMVANNITSITGTIFKPQWLFIATWDHVGYYPSMIDKTNTFQVILTTDGVRSYAIFLYADGLVLWPSTGAQIGFNAGDNVTYASIPGSRTPNTFTSLTNVGVDGRWMFLISQVVPSYGVIYNYDESTLFMCGFVKCYDQPYSSYTITNDLTACSNDSQIVFVGAKRSSASTVIAIGAFGSSNVFSITRSINTAYYDIGGAYWYRYPSRSFGFASTSIVELNFCDDYGLNSIGCTHRLCWHLDQSAGGYRAGCVEGLNSDQTWRKVIYKGNTTSEKCYSDTNECTLGISGCNQICINTIGGYTCSCHPGYQISSNNRTCVDTDECTLGINGCKQICSNTIGSYVCSCYSGYQISSDNRTCLDVDECAEDTSECSHICTNTNGSYGCSCYPGYQPLSYNYKICVDYSISASNSIASTIGISGAMCVFTVILCIAMVIFHYQWLKRRQANNKRHTETNVPNVSMSQCASLYEVPDTKLQCTSPVIIPPPLEENLAHENFYSQ